jgi:hypothetical protein
MILSINKSALFRYYHRITKRLSKRVPKFQFEIEKQGDNMVMNVEEADRLFFDQLCRLHTIQDAHVES